jgi:type VI secretion system secreted protein VgrG
VQGQGESDCERLCPGRLFSLQEHSREDYNGRYLLTHVSHEGSQPQVLEEEAPQGEFSYSNSFTCIPEKVPFRPFRATPRPYVQGGQTAVVVGPEGEEIHVDEWGRVKVQFHWDRQGKLDENSSCWVRVSQPWGGELWGRMFIPRIGQEVIVDFIEGDPDRPIITGRVYNGANLVPYELPAEKTKSTIKSNSSKGGDGYNELRFEDEKHKEQFFMHAERNMDVHVKNDSFENILHDRHQTIGSQGKKGKVGDQNELVYRDKSLTVHRHSQEHVGGNLKRYVGGIDGAGDVDIVIKSNRMELVHKNSHLHVKQNLNEKVDATRSLQVGKDLHVKVGQLNALETGREIHLKSNKIVVEAASGITIQAPGGFITIDAGGIAIKGAKVLINSGGSALSGSGVKPVTPTDAVEARPTVPALADDGKVRAPSGLAVAQGATPQKRGGLSGHKTKIPPGEKDPDNIRALTRENEAAVTLTNNGYDVEQNPPSLPNGRNPDYRINNEYYDCYAPSTQKPRNIASYIEKEKVLKGQADKVVLNLDDSQVSMEAMKKQLMDYPISGLKEVLVVKRGSVTKLFP